MNQIPELTVMPPCNDVSFEEQIRAICCYIHRYTV